MINDIAFAQASAEYENSISEPPKSEEEILQEIEERSFWEDYFADL